MTIKFSKPFVRLYRKLPPPLKTKVDRQLKHLAQNILHPGLNVRKMRGHKDVWEARIDEHFRVTFEVSGEYIIMRKVGTHEIYGKP